MAGEESFKTYLLPFEEAMMRITLPEEAAIVRYAQFLWSYTWCDKSASITDYFPADFSFVRLYSHRERRYLPTLSQHSSSSVPYSAWCSSDFVLSAGMVIIELYSQHIVLFYDIQAKSWFLPSGRKKVGESLEETALRRSRELASIFVTVGCPCN